MRTTRPRPSGRWNTVSSLAFPRTSRRSHASLSAPLTAASSPARVRGSGSARSPRSKTPLTVRSATASSPSRRSTWTFMAQDGLHRGSNLLPVDSNPGRSDAEEVFRDACDVPARVLRDVLQVDAQAFHRDLIVGDGGVVQEDDVPLVSVLRYCVKVLEPKDLREADR